MKMRENKGAATGEGGNSSRSGLELNGKPLDFRSIMKEVELLGDCLQVVSKLKSKSCDGTYLGLVIKDILLLVECFDLVEFVHVFRGANSVAHAMALLNPRDYCTRVWIGECPGSSDMTWKERKDLQNKKVISLGGKAPKKQRLPLSVAKPMMKNQKKREEKMLQEELLLGHCGENMIRRTKKPEEKRKPEDSVLRSSAGRFRNGVLDVKHLLKSAPPPKDDDDHGPPMASKGKKQKGGKKKKGGNPGKRKGGKKRH